jgi:hypothetical protein
MGVRQVVIIDAHAVRVCAARGLNMTDTALALGYVPNALTIRLNRDRALRAEFDRGAAEHAARVAYDEAYADEVVREGETFETWDERLARREERQRNYAAHTAADYKLVLETLERAAEWLCRRELKEQTCLDYRRINDALDVLIADSLVRRLPDRNLIEYFAIKEPV